MTKFVPEKETFRLGESSVLLAELSEREGRTKTEIIKRALKVYAIKGKGKGGV